jgi:hypothetical protein
MLSLIILGPQMNPRSMWQELLGRKMLLVLSFATDGFLRFSHVAEWTMEVTVVGRKLWESIDGLACPLNSGWVAHLLMQQLKLLNGLRCL